jgi:hypothetical protein
MTPHGSCPGRCLARTREAETRDLLKPGVLRPSRSYSLRGERLRPFAACPKRDWQKAVLDKTENLRVSVLGCTPPYSRLPTFDNLRTVREAGAASPEYVQVNTLETRSHHVSGRLVCCVRAGEWKPTQSKKSAIGRENSVGGIRNTVAGSFYLAARLPRLSFGQYSVALVCRPSPGLVAGSP